MNERIVELKKQAWEYTMAVHDGHIVPPLNKEVWPVDKVFDEKFAELIVRECAGVCDDERDSTDSEFGKLVAEGCALKIMERFGVEE
jgi:hypothetical protein